MLVCLEVWLGVSNGKSFGGQVGNNLAISLRNLSDTVVYENHEI